MDVEEREKLNATYRLVEENNKILRKLHRTQRWNTIGKVFYWLLIVALALGAYYYLQPILDQIKNVTGGKLNFEELIKNIQSKK